MYRARMLLLLLVLAGLAGACSVIARRAAVERASNKVELAVDADEVRLLASAIPGATPESVLAALQDAGVTGIAVTEPILDDMLRAGRARFEAAAPAQAQGYVIRADTPVLEAAISRALSANGLSAHPAYAGSGETAPSTRLEPMLAGKLPLGFALTGEQIAHFQRELGLDVIARAYNFPAYSKGGFGDVCAEIRLLGIERVIFAADEVAGWRGALDEAAEALQSNGLIFGSIEFGKQKGSDRLERKLQEQFVRVHSISNAEMANYQPSEAVERFVRAARERNIRILYVRLLTTSGADALQDNVSYISDITAGLRRSGLEPGIPGTMPDPQPRAWERLLIAVGAAAAACLLLEELFALGAASLGAWFAAGATGLAAVSFAGTTGSKLIALAAALVFPTWALLRCARLSYGGGRDTGIEMLRVPGHYLSAITLTAVGGLYIAAILTGRAFMLHTDGFSGVKVAHLLPVLAVLAAAVSGTLGKPTAFGQWMAAARKSLRDMWDSPVLFRYAIVGMGALVMLLMVVLRSGNEAGVGVSPLELKFRAILDQVLYVRPRTKEILLGYPALWAAIWLARRGERNWSRVLFVAGVVGLVSAVNTFCHIHTPLAVSLVRVVNGAWVGAVAGVVLVWIIRKAAFSSTEQTH